MAGSRWAPGSRSASSTSTSTTPSAPSESRCCEADAMADWVTISSLATAGGTLVLATATFASVRSANKAARTAERSLLAGLRPLLTNSRLDDAPVKVSFMDEHFLYLQGSRAAAEETDEAIYLGISVRNVGSGVAVMHGWRFFPHDMQAMREPPDLAAFHRLTRDIFVGPGDVGFWQGALRDPSVPEFATAAEAIRGRSRLGVDVLYGDFEGGQRSVTRFGLYPRDEGDYLATVGRHWNIDRDDPR